MNISVDFSTWYSRDLDFEIFLSVNTPHFRKHIIASFSSFFVLLIKYDKNRRWKKYEYVEKKTKQVSMNLKLEFYRGSLYHSNQGIYDCNMAEYAFST